MSFCCPLSISPCWRRRGANQRGSVEVILTEHSHLDVTRRLEIGERRTSGGYSIIYKGTLKVKRSKNRKEVAIKVLRIFDTGENGVQVRSFV
jgi:hypothetical protein